MTSPIRFWAETGGCRLQLICGSFEACGGAGKVIPPSEVPGAINEDGSLKKGIYRCEYDQHTFDYIKVPGMLFVDGSGNYWSSELYGSQKDYALFMFPTMKMSPLNSPATASSDSLSVLYQIDYNLRRAPC